MSRFLILTVAAGVMAFFPALADDHSVTPITDPLVKKECGACHMAFQAEFLPASAWGRIMANLGSHFGEDATLKPEVRDSILAYYNAHAGRGRSSDAESLRITEASWWVRKHKGEVKESEWVKAKSKANCVACHKEADAGVYED
ncbi:MAG: cytochrome C [Alphaproteobacteria bacterium]